MGIFMGIQGCSETNLLRLWSFKQNPSALTMKLSPLFMSVICLQCCCFAAIVLTPMSPSTAFAEGVLSQPKIKVLFGSVNLQSKTAVLRFGKQGAAFPDYKEAVIRYPVASGLTNAAILKQVQTAISLKQVLGQSLEEMRQDYIENHWLTEVEYAINYNRNNILDLTYTVSGVGAYPSGFEKWVSVDLKTGKRLRVKDLFKADGLGAIAQSIDQKMQQNIRQKIAKVRKQEPDLGLDVFANHRFQPKNLENFTIGKTGITFHYSFDFSHVIKAAEPSGDYLIPYSQLTRYIRPDGVLGFHLNSTKPTRQ
jgi:hypothetical protein